MLHEPAVTSGKDPAFPYKRKLGARLFIAYALFYAGFVAINLTVVGGSEASFLTVYPTGEPLPVASSINWSVVLVAAARRFHTTLLSWPTPRLLRMSWSLGMRR